MIRDLRFFCQKVLPVVYDDSLSFQELLYKVTYKINEMIPVINDLDGEIEKHVAEILTEWKDDGTLELIIEQAILKYMKWYYIPEDFGGVGDGVTDCTDAFDAACKAMESGDIKTLYIPAGKTYVIKNTIALPANSNLIGSGETSRIFWDETVRTYGVGITAGGDNVTIENLRIDQVNTGTVTLDNATGSMGFGTLDAVGKVEADLTGYGFKSKKNIYIHNVWCNGRYAMQVEVAENRPYTMSNIVLNGLYAPLANVSFMARQGKIKNLHYSNIECDYIRAGAAGTEEWVDNCIIENFKCRGARLYAAGCTMKNGVIDCSTITNNTQVQAIALRTGTILDNVKMIGGNAQYTSAISLLNNDATKFYSIKNCDISGFDNFAANSNTPTLPMHLTNCNIDWNTSSRPIIIGTIRGCNIKNFAPRTPIYFEDTVSNISNSVLSWTVDNYSNARFPERQWTLGGLAYIQTLKVLDNMAADNVVFNIASDYLDRYDNENAIIPVTLISNDQSTSIPSTIRITNGQGILNTTGITISDYRFLYINSCYHLATF